LSTSFHRVYLSNDAGVVENLPRERTKAAVAIRLNSFAGSQIILRNTVNVYHDTFVIWAASIENETVLKISPFFSIMPGFRIYTQSEAEAFAPHKGHDPFATYYTSDYDLSAFNTYSGSIGFKVRQLREARRGSRMRTFTLRYQFLHRSTQLNAHALSLVILWESIRQRDDQGK
jgi:hypothetical protein